MRREKDILGYIDLNDDALYGIHSLRAVSNFPDNTPFHKEWYEALGAIKRACYITYKNFSIAVKKKYPSGNSKINLIDSEIINALIEASVEIENGMHFSQFIVPAIQGGAGTSINMNINEIIANRALQISGRKAGSYSYIDPIQHANICQSTNDVIPTSLKTAVLKLLLQLEQSVDHTRMLMENHERNSGKYLRTAYTQMQEAVPSSYGQLFSTYCESLSRDWWRISKCGERIKVVNLGGSAIGTSITVPVYFVQNVIPILREITGLPLAKAENYNDITANIDSLVEMHGIMKAHAVNLEKICSDLRLLSSDLVRNAEIKIPPVQTGSSVMPGKVNPVIPEFIISAAHRVYSNDLLITGLCGQGCLDLNAYLPTIGQALIESTKLLIACNKTLADNLLANLKINASETAEKLLYSPAITTSLIPYIGYHEAARLAKRMKEKNCSITEANEILNVIDMKKLLRIIKPDKMLKQGYSIEDIIENDE